MREEQIGRPGGGLLNSPDEITAVWKRIVVRQKKIIRMHLRYITKGKLNELSY